jgi:predicted Zn-dependent peptidase
MISIRRDAARLAVLVLVATSVAAGSIQLDQYASTVHEFELANGLRVILVEDHGSPVVTACLTARGGYADDPKGMRGLASLMPLLLEHGPEQLGSRNLTEERAAIKAMNAAYAEWKALEQKPGASALYDRLQAEAKLKVATRTAEALTKPQFSVRALEHYGAKPFRAITTADHIQWSARLPSNRVDAFLLLYGEWLRQPLPRLISWSKELRAKAFAQRQATQDAPIRRAILSLAYGTSGYGLAEWEQAEAERIQFPDVEAFLKSRLVASNLVLTLAGDLTLESARAMTEKYMGKVPAGSPFTPAPVTAAEPKEVRAASPAEAPLAIAVGYRRPSEFDPDDPTMDVIQELMIEGTSSRFRKEFLRAHPMLAGVIPLASIPGSVRGGLMATIVPHHPAKRPIEWVNLIGEFIEQAGKTPMSEESVTRAQRSLETRLLGVLADPSQAAHHIGRMGDWARTAELPKAWARVTPADVQRVAAKYLRPELRVILQPGYNLPSAGAGVSK